MTKEDFKNAGYIRFEPPPYENCITDMFQKCFTDEEGNKLYFITVERWDYTPVAPRGQHIPISYNFTVQFNTHDNRTLNIDCFDGYDIESAEKFYADMWNTGWFKMFERKYHE